MALAETFCLPLLLRNSVKTERLRQNAATDKHHQAEQMERTARGRAVIPKPRRSIQP